ncbi:MAG TPA: HD domain-containing protein [Candidatus Onthousia excrementipullorum]|uniref:HD domain-containing protein n=1 Tax=Candidatus Onthousia excrementipullorum TaxID=2840884 RepID=A0A9D1J2R0_9FIRM|nr:HD domain-containing protein [Candidatus Onthousia excrementipullorum]
MGSFEKAKENFLRKEKDLSPYATKSSDAVRFKEEKEDIRPPFFHDIDRIIHSLSYTRYLNKTQVYTLNSNDHVSRRITHVQLVSKIARTIGRALNLNEDLIEAIALGHDIGHTPLGHTGEAILNRLSLKELGEYFAHNIQGVRYYMDVAKDGEGLNLTLQTLDGIMTHNGEMLSPIYEPMKKDKNEFLREYNESYKDLEKSKTYRPMTLEGCVVRISDIIGYIGRDIEDAIMIDRFKRSDIPESIRDVLGDNNRDIVNTIVLDIINESIDKPYIKMSDKVYNALFALKKFNNENIYKYSMTKEELNYYEAGINKLYNIYLDDIKTNNKESDIYKIFLNHQDKRYLESTNIKRWVIDYIAGMTDDFLIREIKNHE